MRVLSILFHGILLLVDPAFSAKSHVRSKRGSTPGGNVDPGTASDCTYWEEVVDATTTCKSLEDTWSIAHKDFAEWNPSIKADCSGMKVGNSYCVEVNYGLPRTVTTTFTTTRVTIPTGNPLPSPTQNGLIKSCTKFYFAKSGDTCDKIVGTYGTFSFADFLNWNPAVGKDCSSLLAGTHYCVGIPGTPTVKPTAPTTEPTAGPSPTQDGLIKSCSMFYKAKSGDTCQGIVSKYSGIGLDDFYKWNPAVQSGCTGLLRDYYYCIGVPLAFRLKMRYSIDCKGAVHKDLITHTGSSGSCINTDCKVGSLEIAAEGLCPDGQVQISYWEKPNCAGKWYGYGYSSKGRCHKLFTDGYKFKSLHLRCSRKEDDCLSKNTCKYDPEPVNKSC